MITIRDYAKENNVSYEAIRKQIKRYEDELNGHIIKQNRTQFLDDRYGTNSNELRTDIEQYLANIKHSKKY